MNEIPILATVVETPTVRPRLYVSVDPDRVADTERYTTSCAYELAERAIADGGANDVLFALPGSAETWTEEKVRAEAREYVFRERGDDDPVSVEYLMDFASVLGVLP